MTGQPNGPWEIETRIMEAVFEQADKMQAEEPDATSEEVMISCIGAAIDWQSSKYVKLCEIVMELCLELEKERERREELEKKLWQRSLPVI